MLLSDRGLLMPYTVVNSEPSSGTTYDFVKPPKPLAQTGERVAAAVMPPPSSLPSSSALGSMKLGGATKPASVTSGLLSQAPLQPTTVSRSLSMDKATVSSSPFSMGGSLPNLMPNMASKPPPQMMFPPLAKEGQKATFSLGGNFIPQSNTTPPPAPFNHPLLSSTPISVAASLAPLPFSAATNTVVNTVLPPPTGKISAPSVQSSTTPAPLQIAAPKLVQAPPPSVVQIAPSTLMQGTPPTLVQTTPLKSVQTTPPTVVQVAPPRSVQTAPPTSSALPASSLHKFMTSQAMPTKPSAPSPTFSVTSSVEEENVEMKLQAAIEQEVRKFSVCFLSFPCLIYRVSSVA